MDLTYIYILSTYPRYWVRGWSLLPFIQMLWESGKSCKKQIAVTLTRKMPSQQVTFANMQSHVGVRQLCRLLTRRRMQWKLATRLFTGILRDGSLTAAFECHGKGKVMYLHHQHTKTEARYVMACHFGLSFIIFNRAEIVCWVCETSSHLVLSKIVVFNH
jgi:hypothetical protein